MRKDGVKPVSSSIIAQVGKLSLTHGAEVMLRNLKEAGIAWVPRATFRMGVISTC